MTPFHFTLSSGKSLIVIPDTQAHLNGHVLLTYTYSIYLDNGDPEPKQGESKSKSLHLTKNDDPSYCGVITFEKPGKLFSYTSGKKWLDSAEVQEVIEDLSHIRDNPSLWKNIEDL